ncbi:AAA family ATPase [Actinomycetospora endophytica]|uniref:AAA family ATPase n=1 Tax=Actinomycetospora endophytica TaxID=2291215 RepID=A0ABS8PB10_9PSEU|nr:LuxR family transcriptional regulator [Actinomycetospora endophytica]MCD2195435.1 AAA family ATPase [Actinomycetospora endophytica]
MPHEGRTSFVPAGPSLVCAELIGRDAEAAVLRRRLAATAAGTGGVVVLVGDAGAGKSRLVREATTAARDVGATVLSGRAVPGAHPVAYRPLAEALLAASRTGVALDSPELAGFHGHLGRLVPAWHTASTGLDDSPVLLGEGVARLLTVLGRDRGCLLVLEDLHWSDPETLDAVDHLADALHDSPVLCLATARPDGAASGLVERLTRRDPDSTIPVSALPPDDVDRMVSACLHTVAAPSGLEAFVRTHSEGIPFLVEELLAGLVASGTLAFDDGRWSSSGELVPTVPGSLRESIRRRLAALDPTTRRVVDAAALLGRRFDWQLLPGIAEVDGRDVVDGLRAALAEQLIEVEGTGFAFRHALTREAVLAEVLPPDRMHLSRRAWPAIERAHPGLSGAVCEQAAELAEAAGAPEEAADRLVESARRALSSGALVTAEATARRARRLAPDDSPVALAADEMLLHVLVAAGKPGDALAVGHELAGLLADDPDRRADLLVVLTRAALAAGDTAAAVAQVDAARTASAGDLDEALGARIDAVAAHVALDDDRPGDAAALARAAVDAAADTAQPAVECEALEVLGRVAAARGPDAAIPWLQRASDVAERHGLADRHLRARQEIALARWGRGELAPLRETRDLAQRYGALITTAVMDLSLADVALSNFDREGALTAARSCAAASERYGLATGPVAHLWLAGAYALAGDDAAMQASVDDALARDPHDPRILGDLYGRVLATRAFVADDLDALPGVLDTMMEHVRVAPPRKSIYPGRALWVTVHAISDDDLGAAARAEFAETAPALGVPLFTQALDVVEAIARGRRGDADGAAALMAPAHAGLRTAPLGSGLVHAQQLLVARAAARDGWGEPATWLRECEAFFTASGHERTARRCRALLGATGAPVPRRGPGTSDVPVGLRALGVTGRELDVLRLVAQGRSTREIGASLQLSTKTVERHLSSLFDRTGVRNRGALGDLARTHGVVDG